MKLSRGARSLIIIGRYRRLLCLALLDLRRKLASGRLTTRQLKALQNTIAGHRDGMAYTRAVHQRTCAAAAL